MNPNKKLPKLPYLTKECSNETFKEEYAKRLEKVEGELNQKKEEVKTLRQSLKKMEKQEESIFGDDKKTIPHFQRKRALKEKLKSEEEKIQNLETHRDKIIHHQTSINGWEGMFKQLNIDLTSRKIRGSESSATAVDPYHNNVLDKHKLNSIKSGVKLLVPAFNEKLNFANDEKKYKVDKLIRLQEQKLVDLELRRVAAKERVKKKLQNDSRRITMLTKSQQYGSNMLIDSTMSARRKGDEPSTFQHDPTQDSGVEENDARKLAISQTIQPSASSITKPRGQQDNEY